MGVVLGERYSGGQGVGENMVKDKRMVISLGRKKTWSYIKFVGTR